MTAPNNIVKIPQKDTAKENYIDPTESEENKWLFNNRLNFDTEKSYKFAFNNKFRADGNQVLDGSSLTTRVKKICVRNIDFLVEIGWTKTLTVEEVPTFIRQAINFCVLNNIRSETLCTNKVYFAAFCEYIHRNSKVDIHIRKNQEAIENGITKIVNSAPVNIEQNNILRQKEIEHNTTLKNLLINVFSSMNNNLSEDQITKFACIMFELLVSENQQNNNELLSTFILLSNNNLNDTMDINKLVNMLTMCSNITVMEANNVVMFN